MGCNNGCGRKFFGISFGEMPFGNFCGCNNNNYNGGDYDDDRSGCGCGCNR